jgi:Lamin Tail Domain
VKQFNKQEYIDQLSGIEFTQDEQIVWDKLEKGVSEHAAQLHQRRSDLGTEGTLLSDWWTGCCELLLARQIIIRDLNFYGVSEEGGEYIELLNRGPVIVDLAGWKVNAGNEGQDMVFPANTLLYPKSTIRVYTDNYTDNDRHLSFNSRQSVWNNKGDQAVLYDHNGQIVSTWIYGEKAHNDVVINTVFYDGKEKHTEADEYAEITNLGLHWIDLSGWELSAGEKQNFVFPARSVLKPNAKIRVYTNQTFVNSGGYSFNSPRAVWNNKGDTAILKDYRGKTVFQYTYH